MAEPELKALRELAERAGSLALGLQAGIASGLKGDGTIVTEADLRAEELLREGLEELFPGVRVVGEEGGGAYGGVGLAFYLDPIDGTLSYARGSHTWAVSVGLLADGEPAAGAVAMPAVSEGVWGAVGLGAWLNGQPVRRGPTVLGSNSLLSVTTGALRRFGPPPHEMGHVRAHGSIAWEMALCACGQVDAAVLSRWKPWDVVAGAAVVVAAGGMVVTAEEGAPVPSWTGEYRGEIVAGGPNLGDLVPETVPGWRIR